MNAPHLRTGLIGTLLVSSLAACSGGSGSGSSTPSTFQVQSISVPEGAPWPINKRIEISFTDEVDLSTVIAGSSLQLKSIDQSGAAAFWDVGYKVNTTTLVVDKTTLVIQPFCPLKADLSDAGLMPGAITYELFLPKGGAGGAAIKSINGVPLKSAQTRTFTTPDSSLASEVFDDGALGAPTFVPELSFVRLGDGQEIPFVSTGTEYELPATLPLNLYSDSDTQVEFLVQLNQAVSPSASNLNDDRVRLEYLDGGGLWQPVQTLVELEANCLLDKPGAVLRLIPQGILPQDTQVRVALVAGFTDIVGQQVLSDKVDFFADTQTLNFVSLTPPDDGADEVYEDFLMGAGESGSLQDDSALYDTPGAVWEGGQLTAAFEFEGTGGPNGTFDWHTPGGTINFSTSLQTILGGPDGVPAQNVQVVNGKLDVNDLVISANTYLRVAPGINPLTIFATGDVRIAGTIDISGYDAKLVGTLLTPHLPENGAVGAAGGGTGGTGSFLTTTSTPRGGNGDGPFGLKNAGGQGGESGYFGGSEKQKRRGGGGGGGVFGPSYTGYDDLPEDFHLVATDGNPGHPEGFGATDDTLQPYGGPKGNGPFLDPDPDNNFFGQSAQYDPKTDALIGVTNGELAQRWAGYGGGAGGDSINFSSFPSDPFGPPYKFDKKGAGGGGGAGQLRIVALGRIIFEPGGRILANGGVGATGENVNGYDHIGGSSAGGSGGHVILESASQIDFTDGTTNQVVEQFIQAYGAEGGIGQVASNPDSASKGGNGGPGVIQLHVPDANPATAVGPDPSDPILIQTLDGGGAPAELDDVTRPPAQVLVPTFGARSKARSTWIPLGGASIAPGGGDDQVLFKFQGTDASGDINATGGTVDPLAPILGPETLGTAAPSPFVDTDGFTLVLSSGSLLPLTTDGGEPSLDIYLRNPSLLTNFQVRLSSASTTKSFTVTGATYADAGGVLRLVTDASGGSLSAFVTAQGGPAAVDYELIPRFFRVQTGVVKDLLPDSAYVRVLFQGTGFGIGGVPSETPLVDWTPDIDLFNTATAPGELKFLRWEIEFNLDKDSLGLTDETVPIALEFLRIPFSF